MQEDQTKGEKMKMKMKLKHRQRHCFLFLLLFLRLDLAADLSAANASEPVDFVEAVDGSCMSLALHEYYTDPSRQPKTQDTSCDSQDKIKEATSSVPNFEPGPSKETNGAESYDSTYGENEACNPLISLSNASPLLANGYSYPVFTAENCNSDKRGVSAPPYLIFHENFASKNEQIEVVGQEKLIKHGQAFDEVAAPADTFIHSDSVNPFVWLIDSKEIKMNLITWGLLRLAKLHLTCLAVMKFLTIFTWISYRRGSMKLLKVTFSWISYQTRMKVDLHDPILVKIYHKVIIIILILLSGYTLGTINTRIFNPMLNVEMLGTDTEDVRTEVGAFQTITPSMASGQISKEGVEKNSSWPDDGLEQFAKEGEYATSARSSKAYKKLRVRIPFKHVVQKFIQLNHKFKGNQLVKTSLSVHSLKWVLPTLPYRVSGESFTNETNKGLEEYYEELISELHSKVNNSLSFEDPRHMVVEHGRSTRVVKNRESGLTLKILVPYRNAFREFVNVDHDPVHNRKIVTGYSIEVFEAVMHNLSHLSYEFFLYDNGHSNDLGYDDELIQQLHFNKCDAVVGDITITSNRSEYGDFTQPYMTSGVSMVVPVRENSTKSLWWFLKPFTLELWLVIIALFLSKAFLIWVFEQGSNRELQGTFPEQVGKILSLSFSIFILAHGAKLKSNYSRVVVYIWIVAMLFVATIYAAILQSMMTSDNGGPIVMDIEQLLANQDYVGYQKGSFVFEILKDMGFQEARLKAYSSEDEYATALSIGSHHGGVSAIIDEIPYIKIFLAKYGDRYTMAGQTFKPAGFGFVFRKCCAITQNVSRAVLRFMEGEKMPELEKKWFGSLQNPLPPPESGTRMSTHGFRGILLITESLSGMAFTIFIIPVIRKYWKKRRRDLSSNIAIRVGNSEASHVVQIESDGAAPSEGHAQMEVATNDSNHLEITCLNDSLTAGDESEQTLHSPALPAVEIIAAIPPVPPGQRPFRPSLKERISTTLIEEPASQVKKYARTLKSVRFPKPKSVIRGIKQV